MQKWSNIHKIHFKSTHEGYPILEPTEYKPIEKWIGLNEVLTYEGDKAKVAELIAKCKEPYEGVALFEEYRGKAKRFRLDVTADNEGAIRLYERMGFSELEYKPMVIDFKEEQ